jgi:hypothetical protein
VIWVEQMATHDGLWWQRGIFYQVYPRSFQDTNADGVGDLNGVRQRLPYLAELGIDAIWLSPVFPSPMADFGYDICDYKGIDPLFGSMADFDATTPPTSTRGLSKAAAHATIQSGTGISGATRNRTAVRPTTGFRSSAAAPGSMMPPPGNTTITRSCASSRISTGATRRCGRQFTT